MRHLPSGQWHGIMKMYVRWSGQFRGFASIAVGHWAGRDARNGEITGVMPPSSAHFRTQFSTVFGGNAVEKRRRSLVEGKGQNADPFINAFPIFARFLPPSGRLSKFSLWTVGRYSPDVRTNINPVAGLKHIRGPIDPQQRRVRTNINPVAGLKLSKQGRLPHR